MCGFALLQKKKNFGLNNKKFFQSTKFLSHRGPDDNHHYIDESILANFYRLSIFD